LLVQVVEATARPNVPELLRTYGEILQQRSDGEFIVFAVLTGIVCLVIATITAGALVQGATRAWKRARRRG
jgi:hypothetical protein